MPKASTQTSPPRRRRTSLKRRRRHPPSLAEIRATTRAKPYTEKDYRKIAKALELQPAMVKQRSSCFEAAARWYFSDLREPKRARPTALHKRFLQIRDAADRLLAHLGIDSPEDAADGPGDPYIFDELIMATDDGTEDDVARATEKVARLSVLLSEALSAAGELRIRAQQAADDVVDIGKLTVPKGFPGDRALNSWTWRMLVVHKLLTGQNALSPLQLGQGIRLYRFLAAAGRPLGIEQSQSQWKERVKTIITSHTEYTNDSP